MEVSPDMVAAGSIADVERSRMEVASAERAEFSDAATAPFLGRWQRLVSTTNWEKGRIIHEWREALIAADRPAAEYADDAWASRVGNVTSQHVGRLRRVFARFGAKYGSYEGLYWSHFQAAVDWEDAEMWLEGGLQNDWSVNTMRMRRAETLGDSAADVSDVEAAELVDEDADASAYREESSAPGSTTVFTPTTEAYDESQFASHTGRGEGASDDEAGGEGADGEHADAVPWEDGDGDAATVERVVRQPFAALPELPDDLQSAFDSFKIAILRHRREKWELVTPSDVAATLDGLKELALSPLDA